MQPLLHRNCSRRTSFSCRDKSRQRPGLLFRSSVFFFMLACFCPQIGRSSASALCCRERLLPACHAAARKAQARSDAQALRALEFSAGFQSLQEMKSASRCCCACGTDGQSFCAVLGLALRAFHLLWSAGLFKRFVRDVPYLLRPLWDRAPHFRLIPFHGFEGANRSCARHGFQERKNVGNRPAVRIFDCFLFHSELEMLELRLHELAPAVDFFVLVESTRTFTGQRKPLYYERSKHELFPLPQTDHPHRYAMRAPQSLSTAAGRGSRETNVTMRWARWRAALHHASCDKVFIARGDVVLYPTCDPARGRAAAAPLRRLSCVLPSPSLLRSLGKQRYAFVPARTTSGAGSHLLRASPLRWRVALACTCWEAQGGTARSVFAPSKSSWIRWVHTRTRNACSASVFRTPACNAPYARAATMTCCGGLRSVTCLRVGAPASATRDCHAAAAAAGTTCGERFQFCQATVCVRGIETRATRIRTRTG